MSEETEDTLPVERADVLVLAVLLGSRVAALSARMKQLPVGHLGRTSVSTELGQLADLDARLAELLKVPDEDVTEE